MPVYSCRALCRWLAICAVALMPGAARAASMYMEIAGIPGENPTPGYPEAVAVQSLAILAREFRVTKVVDSASPAIQMAVALGTLLPTGSLLFYDSAPIGQPDVVLPYENFLASSSQLLGGAGGPQEEDTFAAQTPALLYLELPGIIGESSPPGHPDVMQIQSFSTDGSSFSVVKAIDTASPQIVQAVALGTQFPVGRLLLYDVAAASGPPDAMLVFGNLLASSSQSTPGGGDEQDTFFFASIVPEPDGDVMLMASFAVLAMCAHLRTSSPRA